MLYTTLALPPLTVKTRAHPSLPKNLMEGVLVLCWDDGAGADVGWEAPTTAGAGVGAAAGASAAEGVFVAELLSDASTVGVASVSISHKSAPTSTVSSLR